MAEANPPLLAALAAGTVGLAATLRFVVGPIRQRWLLADVPPPNFRGVFVGLNEVWGTARTDAPLYSRLCGLACVWCHVVVEKMTASTGSGESRGSSWPRATTSRSGWRTRPASSRSSRPVPRCGGCDR